MGSTSLNGISSNSIPFGAPGGTWWWYDFNALQDGGTSDASFADYFDLGYSYQNSVSVRSMDAYSRALLLFLHAVVGSGPGVEAFAFGTRLSRLTPDLATRDPEAAIDRCTEAVVDWGAGTRIGASLKQFNDVYGRRALTRGAVVVIVSDGWERDDPDLVGREMARLARAAYAVVWVNPLKGNPEYQPLAGGMRAALPFVDRFLPGHNLRSLEELAAVLAGIERRHAA